MSRTNIIIRDTKLFEKARKFSGEKTVTGAIHHAVHHFVITKEQQEKSRKAMEKMSKLFGKVVWEGDLKAMRKSRI